MKLVNEARQFKEFCNKHSRLLALGGCIFLSFVLAFLRVGTVTFQPGRKIDLDTSWIISLPVLLRQGDLLGRDVLFPHGPLSQILGTLNNIGNNGAYVGQAKQAEVIFGIILAGLCVALLKPLNWKHILIVYGSLVALDILSEPGYFRSFMVVLCAIVLARSLTAPTLGHKLTLSALCGGLCLAGQLITFDQGIYNSFSALAVVLFFLFLNLLLKFFPTLFPHKEFPTLKDCLVILVGVAGVYLGGNLLVSLFYLVSGQTYEGLFDYQFYNLEIVRGFNNTMGLPWTESWVTSALLVALLVYLVGFVLVALRRLSPLYLPLPVCLVIFAIPPLKSAITRSDGGHLAYGSLSLVFAFIVLGFSLAVAPFFRIFWYILLALLLLYWPTTILTSGPRLGETFGIGERPKVSLTPAYLAQQVPPGLSEAADPTKAQLDFPYDNFIAIGMGRSLFAPVVQSYSAHTEALQKKYIELLDQSKNEVEIVYALDDQAVDRLDNVQNISRVPGIFDYIYRNYELKTPRLFGSGYLLLQSRATPLPALTGDPLTFQTSATGNPAQDWTFKLDQPANCSLLRLMVAVNYPPLSLIGHPDALQMTVWAGNQQVKQASIVPLETGRAFSTYFQLIEPGEFASVFSGGPVATQSWDRLEITPRSGGFFGITPDRFELKGLECVRFAQPVLSDRDASYPPDQPGVWQAFSLQPAPVDNQGRIPEFTISGHDPRLVLNQPLNLCLADYSHFYLKLSVSSAITDRRLKIYYRLNGQPDFSEQNSIAVNLAKDEADQSYLYDLRFLGFNKEDRLTGLRFDPVTEGTAADSSNWLRLEDFRLLRNSSIFTNSCG